MKEEDRICHKCENIINEEISKMKTTQNCFLCKTPLVKKSYGLRNTELNRDEAIKLKIIKKDDLICHKCQININEEVNKKRKQIEEDNKIRFVKKSKILREIDPTLIIRISLILTNLNLETEIMLETIIINSKIDVNHLAIKCFDTIIENFHLNWSNNEKGSNYFFKF